MKYYCRKKRKFITERVVNDKCKKRNKKGCQNLTLRKERK